MRLRFRYAACLLLAMIVAACQGPPPTQIYIVFSPTPDGTQAPTQTPYVIVVTATPAGGAAATAMQTAEATVESAVAGLLTPTPLRSIPTAIVNQIQVAEQTFENGRMFWLQPTQQIWVLINDDAGSGRWLIFNDTWVDGEASSDPALTPPTSLYQPIRGFGKLWRENTEVREALGWAVLPETGYITTYEYHAGGYIDATTEMYVDAPGYHLLFNQANEPYRFDAGDLTWSVGTAPTPPSAPETAEALATGTP